MFQPLPDDVWSLLCNTFEYLFTAQSTEIWCSSSVISAHIEMHMLTAKQNTP